MAIAVSGVMSTRVVKCASTAKRSGTQRDIMRVPVAVPSLGKSPFRCGVSQNSQGKSLQVGAAVKRAAPRAAILSDDSLKTGMLTRSEKAVFQDNDEG